MNNKLIADYVYYHVHGIYDDEDDPYDRVVNLSRKEPEDFVKDCVKRVVDLMDDFNRKFYKICNYEMTTDCIIDSLHLDKKDEDEKEDKDLKDELFSVISKKIELSLFAYSFINVLKKDEIASDYIQRKFLLGFSCFNKRFIEALRNELNKIRC